MADPIVNYFVLPVASQLDARFDRLGFMVIFAVQRCRRKMGSKSVAIANVRCAVDAKALLQRLRRLITALDPDTL